MLPRSPDSPSVLHVAFNQDRSRCSVASDNGFLIFGCDPFRKIIHRDFPGGIGHVEMLFKSNMFALVGGGSQPQFSPTCVSVWDDNENCSICTLCFPSAVRGVRLRRDRIVVALEKKVFVYRYPGFTLLQEIGTVANPKGLCEVSQDAESMVMACPGSHQGQVRVENYATKKTYVIPAHDSIVACFALTLDGKFLATASTKATLIRVFDTEKGELLQEVRRGTNAAKIYSLAFSSTAQWLAVSSDRGTVHVFSLKVNSSVTEHEKSQSSSNSDAANTPSSSSLLLDKLKGVLPKYFNSEWSVAQIHLLEASHYTVAFGRQKNTVMILGMNGDFHRCQFDPEHGGEMTQLEYHNFQKPEIASWTFC